MRVPLPTLIFGLSSTGAATFAGATTAGRPIPRKPAEITVKIGAIGVPEQPEPDEAEAEGRHDLSATNTIPGPLLPEEPPLANSGAEQQAYAQSNRNDRSTDPLPIEAPPNSELHLAEQPPLSSGADQHAIELSIESLPHLQLIQAIPVTVNPLGKKLFTATVEALNLSGTGDTLSDALITVKEQIELTYQRLIKLTGLDEMEKEYLNYLRLYIKSSDDPPKQKRGIWR